MSDSYTPLLLAGAGLLGLIGAGALFVVAPWLGPESPTPDLSTQRAAVPVPDVASRARTGSAPGSAPAIDAGGIDAGGRNAGGSDADPASEPDADPTEPVAATEPPSEGAANHSENPEDPEEAGSQASTFPVSPEGIRDAIDSQKHELQACYETLLDSYEGEPGLDGQIAVAFEIAEDGRVVGADIDQSEIDSIYLEGCIATAMEDLRFDSGSPGTVTYPFQFEQRENDGLPVENP